MTVDWPGRMIAGDGLGIENRPAGPPRREMKRGGADPRAKPRGVPAEALKECKPRHAERLAMPSLSARAA